MKQVMLQQFRRLALSQAGAAGMLLLSGLDLHAGESKNPTGSPLDTIMQTKLWADVPEAKDFVRDARPSVDNLDYQPTGRTDPKRPALRTKAELDALQAELEGAIAENASKAGRRKQAKPAKAAAAQKIKADESRSN